MMNVSAIARTPVIEHCFIRFIRLYSEKKFFVPTVEKTNSTTISAIRENSVR
jgi:hypothetical protein